MENLEIMNNEEVVETTEEIVKTDFGKGFKVVALVGLTVLVGVAAYKYVVKPTVARIIAKKNQQTIPVVVDNDIEEDETKEVDET